MIPVNDLKKGDMRLLEVDRNVIVPVNVNVRIIVTGADVIHSFAVPSLGLKADAIPGRLNQLNFLVKREGIYYGQCSEICGDLHSYMPIVIQACTMDQYIG
jgi:heme/copper-type cytochrome/quinol oxidase subunit 2